MRCLSKMKYNRSSGMAICHLAQHPKQKRCVCVCLSIFGFSFGLNFGLREGMAKKKKTKIVGCRGRLRRRLTCLVSWFSSPTRNNLSSSTLHWTSFKGLGRFGEHVNEYGWLKWICPENHISFCKTIFENLNLFFNFLPLFLLQLLLFFINYLWIWIHAHTHTMDSTVEILHKQIFCLWTFRINQTIQLA